jgi:hypothetical protein
MGNLRRSAIGIALCVSCASCVSYSSIQKTDKEVYLSGATSYFVVSIPFLKRCDLDGQILRCEELKEFEPSARGAAPAPSAGASTAPASTTAPAAPATAAPAAKPK